MKRHWTQDITLFFAAFDLALVMVMASQFTAPAMLVDSQSVTPPSTTSTPAVAYASDAPRGVFFIELPGGCVASIFNGRVMVERTERYNRNISHRRVSQNTPIIPNENSIDTPIALFKPEVLMRSANLSGIKPKLSMLSKNLRSRRSSMQLVSLAGIEE